MKVFKGFSIIFLIYLLGEGISTLLPFHLPGGLIGMGLLFLALSLKWVALHDIKAVSDFFLKYMALFFIPAGVSVMSSYSLLQAHLIPISLTLILSIVSMLVFISVLVDYLSQKVK